MVFSLANQLEMCSKGLTSLYCNTSSHSSTLFLVFSCSCVSRQCCEPELCFAKSFRKCLTNATSGAVENLRKILLTTANEKQTNGSINAGVRVASEEERKNRNKRRQFLQYSTHSMHAERITTGRMIAVLCDTIPYVFPVAFSANRVGVHGC